MRDLQFRQSASYPFSSGGIPRSRISIYGAPLVSDDAAPVRRAANRGTEQPLYKFGPRDRFAIERILIVRLVPSVGAENGRSGELRMFHPFRARSCFVAHLRLSSLSATYHNKRHCRPCPLVEKGNSSSYRVANDGLSALFIRPGSMLCILSFGKKQTHS